jgi:hypothetical protein
VSVELEIGSGFYTQKMGLNDLGLVFPRHRRKLSEKVREEIDLV